MAIVLSAAMASESVAIDRTVKHHIARTIDSFNDCRNADRKMPMIRTLIATALPLVLVACASSPAGMLEQSALQTFTSAKAPGAVAGCAQQSLAGGAVMGTDGSAFWVTRSSVYGIVVRYDMKPAAGGGSLVEYRSRLKVNNGLDKVKACL